MGGGSSKMGGGDKISKKGWGTKKGCKIFWNKLKGGTYQLNFQFNNFFPTTHLGIFNNVDSPAPSIDYLRFKSFWQVDIPFWSNSSLTPGCVCSRFLFKWQKFQNSHSWLCSYYIILALYLLKFSVVIQSYLY